MINNNDIIRRIRYIFDFNDDTMIKIFGLANCEVSRAEISNWLKKDNDPDYQYINDAQLSIFLDGLIYYKRGKKEEKQPEPLKRLNNNIILRKLKIALNLKDENMLELFDLAGLRISKHEISAFFRNPSQEKYRECKDQFLRNFLYGMQIKYNEKPKRQKSDIS